jgi:hypothetical protein
VCVGKKGGGGRRGDGDPIPGTQPSNCKGKAADLNRVQVFLNGDKLPIKNFMEYVQLYLPDKSLPRIHEKVNDRWEIVVAATPGQFQQVLLCSLVLGMC